MTDAAGLDPTVPMVASSLHMFIFMVAYHIYTIPLRRDCHHSLRCYTTNATRHSDHFDCAQLHRDKPP